MPLTTKTSNKIVILRASERKANESRSSRRARTKSSVIASNSQIDKKAKIGKNYSISEYCLIGASKIGNNAVIRSHTVIYPGNEIGDNFQTGHGVLIRENNKIGNNVSIGSHSTIEHHTKIGNNVRIHSGAFIPEYTVIEDNAWIGPYVVCTNAKYPASKKAKQHLKGPIIKKGAKIGAGSVILPGIIIGENSLVGAGSVVVSDVPVGNVVVGNPAKVIKNVKELKYKDGELAY